MGTGQFGFAIGRFGFRSDTREPDGIFKKGFESREMDVKLEDAYRLSENIKDHKAGEAGDIVSSKAVCLSSRISAAALFPYDYPTDQSYLYFCFVPTGDVFNTHTKQILDGMQKAQAGNPKAAWWAIYAHEYAVKKIQPFHVLAAVQMIRDKAGKYLLGMHIKGRYPDGGASDAEANVKSIQWNEAAFVPLMDAEGKEAKDQETWTNPSVPGLPLSVREMARKVLEAEVKLSAWQDRAKPESGWTVAEQAKTAKV